MLCLLYGPSATVSIGSLFVFDGSFVCAWDRRELYVVEFCAAHFERRILRFLFHCRVYSNMPHITAQLKHSILIHIQTKPADKTYEQIAALHGVVTTRRTITNWIQQWNGTIASLTRTPGSGRPRILTPTQVYHQITKPIRASNRASNKVKYTKITEGVQRKTGKTLSVETVRRIGRTELKAKLKRGTKRTAKESKYIDNNNSFLYVYT